MANVRKTPERVTRAGLEATYHGSLSASDTYLVRGSRTLLHFKKSGAGDATITFTTDKTLAGVGLEDPTVTVPASTGDVFVRTNPAYEDGDGDIKFASDDITGLTFAALITE